ncbi:hypothetical protein N788_12250 [Arenimonas donghaensis DSM 18148 = HO3-R19]|uniref:Uncharacterized protein n=1 Tax=Arenimonas donghaensis DSM 18148 = HO3-R19 TaxID=1121014 RepID=A0A087MJ39_9GAMM|nr:hypothetical protein N788_12250 [Arenimonas donghaensis DSM 18148 = HO3-R19]
MFSFKLDPGPLDALLSKACRPLRILTLERVQDQGKNVVFKRLALVVHAGGFQEGFDIADGVGRHLQLLKQSANDIFLECALQRYVEDIYQRVL